MTDKIVLGSIASFQNDATAITQYNANNVSLTTALNNTLSRDGTSPNQMSNSLDMNGNQIINLPAPSTINSPARLVDVVTNPTVVLPLVRTRLTADLTLFVNPSTGNDNNNGLSSGTAFQHIQKAVIVAQLNYDLAGFNMTIKLADGTYSENVALGPYVGRSNQGHTGPIIIQGNVATPANVIVLGGSGTCFLAVECGFFEWVLSGMTISSASGAGCILADAGGWVVVGPSVVFGACPSGNHVTSENGGIVEFVNNYTISGGTAGGHLFAINSGEILSGSTITVTLTGTPNFPGGFAIASRNSLIVFNAVTFSGAATGARYTATLGGGIETAGGGANYFPGNSAGSATSPGWYD